MTRTNTPTAFAIIVCATLSANSAYALRPISDPPPKTDWKLYPVCKPYTEGDLKVDDLHTIHYSLHGNPNGKPIFVLHGGPGVGCYPRLTQYFNPDKFLIILHDQRGCGRSTPLGEIRQNTTQNLVADIEKLRTHLNIENKILIFGGSWGTTLALAYAETHPQQVAGLILRGVFTATKAEVETVFSCPASQLFFPEAADDLQTALPDGVSEPTPEQLFRAFSTADDKTAKQLATDLWRYSIKTSKLHNTDDLTKLDFGDWDPRPSCLIDNYYATNTFFLEEGQLLRDATRLSNIPAIIINGRYDVICPPITAYKLHKKLPQSNLVIVEEAGHSESEEGITIELLKAVSIFE